jgi:hypothetical protein
MDNLDCLLEKHHKPRSKAMTLIWNGQKVALVRDMLGRKEEADQLEALLHRL